MAITKEFVRLSIEELTPYENNPRRNDNAVEDVMQSIEQCGELDPIEIDENNVILSGHTRLKAYEQMGFDAVDCVRFTGLTDEQKRKYRLLANKTGEKALWDFDKLETELEGLDFGGWDFGFDSADILPPVPENLDAETDYDAEEPLAVKLTFSNYTEYAKHEDELKKIAVRMGAEFSIVKA